MTSAPLVSVVTPFYNTAGYLAECIESVLSQTFTNFEYILVDNASDDGSSEIAKHYADEDRRVRVVSTDRLLPQVENYNYALSLISDGSAYCKMCQADDWLFPRCVEEMVALAEREPSVGIVSAYSSYGRALTLTGLDVRESVFPGREICRRYFLDGLSVFGSPTAVLYRADIVRSRDPFFEVGRMYEDVELCFEVLSSTDFGFVHQVLTFMRERDESIMGQRADLMSGPLEYWMFANRYASALLSDEEWRMVRRRARSRYYEHLGRRVLRSRVRPTPAGFWEFQREGLSLAGESLSWLRLACGTAIAAVNAALAPRDAISRVRRR